MSNFDGHAVIVTGAGSGIGKATALRFAADGARVALIDIDGASVTSVAREIDASGRDALAIECDVSHEAALSDAFASVVERWGRIDVLHNNAAAMSLATPDGDVADLDVEMWDTKMAVNLRGVMLGCKLVVPTMRAARAGAIINTASVSGLIGTASNAAYGASKAAIINLTRSVASMVGSSGIRCNAVAPGLTVTERVGESMSEETLAIYAAERLLPWPASPSDIAATVVWLASDEARAITGQTIVVDCGTTAHRPRHAIAQWQAAQSTETPPG